MVSHNRPQSGSTAAPSSQENRIPGGLDFRTYQELKSSIHRYLLDKIDLKKVFGPDDTIRAQVHALLKEVVAQLQVPFSASEKDRLILEIAKEVFGLGPLEPLMQDPTITDILVNGSKEVYVERGGVLEETKVVFKDDEHLLLIIQKIVSAVWTPHR